MIELLLQAEGALSVGLLDRAEALYRQVAAADPRNSIAVVGLARVTLERSDEVGALALARRALAIDPENDAANRMVRRLEEVLQTRGVSVEAPGAAVQPAAAEPATTNMPPAAAVEPAAPAPAGSAAPDRPIQRSLLERLLRRRG